MQHEIAISTDNADIQEVYPLLEAYGHESGIDQLGAFDRDAFYSAWSALHDLGVGFLVLYRVDGRTKGAMGAVVSPALFWDWFIATEVFWFVLPELRRGRWPVKMFKLAEAEAKRRGCRHFYAGHNTFWRADHMRRLYQSLGYVSREEMHLKVI